jgi:hypothetical protein
MGVIVKDIFNKLWKKYRNEPIIEFVRGNMIYYTNMYNNISANYV